MKTIGQILTLSTEYLRSKNASQGRLEVEHLIAHVLNISRLELYLRFDAPMQESEVVQVRQKLARLCRGEPLAYIEGQVPFYNCTIFVDHSVLIPRPETEFLVDQVVQKIKKTSDSKKVLFDICTGSGCIGIAIKKALPDLDVYLSDISPEAIRVSEKNAKANNVQVTTLRGDLFAPFKEIRADCIVVNPPYIDEKTYQTLDAHVKDFEPKQALVGGPTGLEFYERFAKSYREYVKDSATIWCEVGYDQAQKIRTLFENQGAHHVTIIKDLSQHERIVEIQVK